MANEIALSWTFTATKSPNFSKQRSFSDNIDLTNARFTGQVQIIGTTHELVVIGSDITTPGVSYFVNNDATNYVELGRDVAATFYPVIKLKPGEGFPTRLATTSAQLYARANTAAVALEYVVLDD